MEPSKSIAKPLGIIGGIVVVIAGIIGYTNMGKTSSDTAADQPATSTDTTTTPTDNTVAATSTTTSGTSTYKDGTYEAQGNYVSPGGAETVGVKLTVANDVVTDAVFTPEATRGTSVQFQNQFAAGYKQYVVGKKLDDINVGRVSGSSLTPHGFNDAVAKIKVEAKA